jgi:hypothetical protein
MAEPLDGVVRGKFALAHLLKQFADGFGVHDGFRTSAFQISTCEPISVQAPVARDSGRTLAMTAVQTLRARPGSSR